MVYQEDPHGIPNHMITYWAGQGVIPLCELLIMLMPREGYTDKLMAFEIFQEKFKVVTICHADALMVL